ncbi:hypothetical protein [Adhaeribacter rhizoryzae]|uniref:Uncharacterized protein n=1 Tax=Adhaeribacter rhizoryzae TaxID=2607907 RepID=A0A5M6DSI9_9BACT|nr:hypothetical protein [Adhaeribacter rhizoryzae]KAA5549209.1 hypothetical protein F0145_01045 [Adhaeribacter rhizoryzae]
MYSRANIAEDILHNSRLVFNLKVLKGKSNNVHEEIIDNWIKFIEYTFFQVFTSHFQSFLPDPFEKTQRTVDDVIQGEIEHLKSANEFIRKLVLYTAYGREENKNQERFNHLMIKFLEKILNRTHPYFLDNFYLKKKPGFNESLIFIDLLTGLKPRKRLLYSASPEYLIQGFNYLKARGKIEVENVEDFVYSNFDFYTNKGYSIPLYKEDFSLKWLGAKGSFPQLLGQLKETKNIIATHEQIVDFVLQYVQMQRSSALQYASLKEKLSKNNIIDHQHFKRK